jgi:DUF3093 family protein
MRVYRERLGVPASWWLLALFLVLMLGTILWAGFSIIVAVAVYAILCAGSAAFLLIWGSVTIELTDAELRAGAQSLALNQVGQVTALDQEQTRALRGPRADPAAYLLIRPYLPVAVYVEVTGPQAAHPYWLIATRAPAELAAAIDRARPGPDRSASCDDVAGDHAAQAGG